MKLLGKERWTGKDWLLRGRRKLSGKRRGATRDAAWSSSIHLLFLMQLSIFYASWKDCESLLFYKSYLCLYYQKYFTSSLTLHTGKVVTAQWHTCCVNRRSMRGLVKKAPWTKSPIPWPCGINKQPCTPCSIPQRKSSSTMSILCWEVASLECQG